MTILNLNSRELRSRRFQLLTRTLDGREDVALGILSHLWLRCLDDKRDGFSDAERLHYVVCPAPLIDLALSALLACGYLQRQAQGYVCADVQPWIAKAHVRLARAKKAGAASVKARAKKRTRRQAVAAPGKAKNLQKQDDDMMATRACWAAYEEKYWQTFHVKPLRNAKTNALIKQFCQRVPQLDAPHVLRFYCGHANSYYAQRMYPLDLAVKDAESLYAQWATGKPITRHTMQQFDERQKARAALDAGISF